MLFRPLVYTQKRLKLNKLNVSEANCINPQASEPSQLNSRPEPVETAMIPPPSEGSAPLGPVPSQTRCPAGDSKGAGARKMIESRILRESDIDRKRKK